MMQRDKFIAGITYSTDTDIFSSVTNLEGLELDELYRVQSEVMNVLCEVFDTCGRKRDETRRVATKSN